MRGVPRSREVAITLAGYAAGAAWFWLDPGVPRVTATDPTGGVLIPFLLPTAAAVLLWSFHAIESQRLVITHEPGDCAATERIVFRLIAFVAGLHGLVLLHLTEAPFIRASAAQLAFVLVGTLLVSVGNLLPRTRPNLCVGIRTSRSLRCRQFWMEINRAGGYVTVALGVVVIAAAAVLRYPLNGQLTLAAGLAAVAILAARYLALVRGS